MPIPVVFPDSGAESQRVLTRHEAKTGSFDPLTWADAKLQNGWQLGKTVNFWHKFIINSPFSWPGLPPG
jgi:hypothetical protein